MSSSSYGVGKCMAIDGGWKRKPIGCPHTGFTYTIYGLLTSTEATLCPKHKTKFLKRYMLIKKETTT